MRVPLRRGRRLGLPRTSLSGDHGIRDLSRIPSTRQPLVSPDVYEPRPFADAGSHRSPNRRGEKIAKVKLKADREKGIIILDTDTSLHGVPPEAWQYKLGNRSAIEWVLDQYKEKKPRDKTIAEKFNTYRFADYKEEVINLLQKVCHVSVETMKIIEQMS